MRASRRAARRIKHGLYAGLSDFFHVVGLQFGQLVENVLLGLDFLIAKLGDLVQIPAKLAHKGFERGDRIVEFHFFFSVCSEFLPSVRAPLCGPANEAQMCAPSP